MLTIRLQRVGRKHEPVFRLVLTDSKNSPKSGKFLEILGHYDARKGDQAQFHAEKVKAWVAKGAKVSDTVHNLLIDKKIISGKKINKLPKKSPILSEKTEEPTNTGGGAPEAVAESTVAAESSPETKEATEPTVS